MLRFWFQAPEKTLKLLQNPMSSLVSVGEPIYFVAGGLYQFIFILLYTLSNPIIYSYKLFRKEINTDLYLPKNDDETSISGILLLNILPRKKRPVHK